MKKKYTLTKFSSIIFMTMVAGCGGGNNSDGMLIEGTLTEAGGASHRIVSTRHSDGQKIENVEICALSQCSTTDGQGQWGFVAPEEFRGGTVTFSVDGHGINTTSSVHIPDNANEVFIDFQHVAGGKVQAHHITVDGQTDHNEPEAHE